MTGPALDGGDARAALLAGYDAALPHVYGYLLARCGTREIAEELTAETFLAAADAACRPRAPTFEVGWLIGVARHKLADHWRRAGREQRNLQAVAADPTIDVQVDDPWEERLDALRARDVLALLAPQYRIALTLRYVDDLPVPRVAASMGRTVHATEALLVRARQAFRSAYEPTVGEGTAVLDAFDDLRDRSGPVAPDAAFADSLRARLTRALTLPTGVVPMTESPTESPTDATDATAAAPALPLGAAVPYLAVGDAQRALAWYVEVFGARLLGEPIVMADGRVGHAELALGDGVLYLADAHPEIGVAAPMAGAASVSLMLAVDDADAVRERAMARGATGDRAPYDGYGRRHAWIVDPFGHRWGLNSALPVPDAAPHGAFRAGDVNHLAFGVPDIERARAFYADVLGWTYLPDGRVAGSVPSIGFRPGASIVTCDYAVTDIEAALDRLRAAGGTAGEIERYPWGTVAECADDQGTPLRLHEVAADAAGTPPPANGARDGDCSYLTLHVVDSARARAFYGAVLGWTFSPGRIEDGWGVSDVAPMTGLSGGHAVATAMPMWRVSDIAAAVARVRANGGTATEPEQQPYGMTSECRDDQGVAFYLGQM